MEVKNLEWKSCLMSNLSLLREGREREGIEGMVLEWTSCLTYKSSILFSAKRRTMKGLLRAGNGVFE